MSDLDLNAYRQEFKAKAGSSADRPPTTYHRGDRVLFRRPSMFKGTKPGTILGAGVRTYSNGKKEEIYIIKADTWSRYREITLDDITERIPTNEEPAKQLYSQGDNVITDYGEGIVENVIKVKHNETTDIFIYYVKITFTGAIWRLYGDQIKKIAPPKKED